MIDPKASEDAYQLNNLPLRRTRDDRVGSDHAPWLE